MPATLPTLDDDGLAARQTGDDPNHGLRIPSASGDLAMPSAAGSGPTSKGKQVVAGSAATSGPSQVRSSSGASSGDAGRRRLHRGDRTPVTEPAAKRQRTAEGAGQGSSQASGPRGSSGRPRRHHHRREIAPSGSSSSGSHGSNSNSNNRSNSSRNSPGLRLCRRHGSCGSSRSSRRASVVAGYPALLG